VEITFKSCECLFKATVTSYASEHEGGWDEPPCAAYVEFSKLEVLDSNNVPMLDVMPVWDLLDPKYTVKIESDCIAAIKAAQDDN
jgi:hypothetical protein